MSTQRPDQGGDQGEQNVLSLAYYSETFCLLLQRARGSGGDAVSGRSPHWSIKPEWRDWVVLVDTGRVTKA